MPSYANACRDPGYYMRRADGGSTAVMQTKDTPKKLRPQRFRLGACYDLAMRNGYRDTQLVVLLQVVRQAPELQRVQNRGADGFEVRRVQGHRGAAARDQRTVHTAIADRCDEAGFRPTVLGQVHARVFPGGNPKVEGPDNRGAFVENGTIVVRPLVVVTTIACRSLYFSGMTHSSMAASARQSRARYDGGRRSHRPGRVAG